MNPPPRAQTQLLILATAASILACAACPALATPIACVGAGVITRIDGDPTGVNIARGAGAVTRPRVLEVICVGDSVSAGGTTRITLSLDDEGVIHVDSSAPYLVAARPGAPTLAGNVYQVVSNDVMPDMKRLAWDVRLKGAAGPFAFALPQLANGGQLLSPGAHALLVRVTGGTGPYSATVAGAGGVTLAVASGADADLVFRTLTFVPGRYHLTAQDGASVTIEADFTVVGTSADRSITLDGIADPEVRAAVVASELARTQSATRALEAEQLLAAAPSNGLDRHRVYDLIESYGAN